MQGKEILTAREYLTQAFYIDHKILEKNLEILRLQSEISKCTPSYGDNPPQQHNDNSTEIKIHNYIDKCEKIKAEVVEEADALLLLKWEIRKKILQISEPKLQMILNYRYWHYYKWREIKVKMNYNDVRGVYKAHDRAISAFIKKFGNRFLKSC